MKVNTLTLKASELPNQLSPLYDPPKQLFIRGNSSLLTSDRLVAMVGSRKVSQYGRTVTMQLAKACALQDVVIVSGLALGVDSIAHAAAVEAGKPTIAVLPCGIDTVYPASHRHLAEAVLANNGLLVSEYPDTTAPFKANFIARNRIIAALSRGVVITEAAVKSGSLHTANFALDLGISVMAVPGNITSDLSAGCNQLIKMGATPVTDADDILQATGLQKRSTQAAVLGNTPDETLILTLLQSHITDASELLLRSKLSLQNFNTALTMLEIDGKVRPLGAGQWTLA